MIEGITDRATFTALRGSRLRVRKGAITITFAHDTAATRPRVAYAIGRGVGNAVQRNRLRRRLRMIMSERGPQLVPGAYLVGAGPQAAPLTFGELKTMVAEALEQVLRQAQRR